MNSFCHLFLTLTTFALFALASGRYIHVDQAVLSQTGREKADESLGLVNGTRSCGGPGRFIQLRVEGCNSNDAPCRVPGDNRSLRGLLEFVPSVSIEQVGLRLFLSQGDSEPQVVSEGAIANSQVDAGVAATIAGSGRFTEELRGKIVTVRHVLYSVSTGVPDLCIESNFQVV